MAIMYIEKEWNGSDAQGYTTQGWYFWDEADTYCYGPYQTQEKAKHEEGRYAAFLNDGPSI
jgi:hypothetical protein